MNITTSTNSQITAQQSQLRRAEAEITKQNQASAEATSQLDVLFDTVEVRNKPAGDFPLLDNQSLVNVLDELSKSFVGKEEELVAAQGNLNPDSVLALLKD